MELHTQQRLIPIEKLSFPLAFVLFLAISMATLLARIGIVTPETLDDPFHAYADIFPGQPRSAALVREFLCRETPHPSPADVVEECVYASPTGSFSQIRVVVWDSMIVRLDFSVRANMLRVGELLIWWGSDELECDDGAGILRWPERKQVATGYFPNGRLTYFSSVSQVSFTR